MSNSVIRNDRHSKNFPEVTVSDLRGRIKGHAHETLTFLCGVTKAITLANAAYAIASLVAAGISPILWAPFWLASFLAIIVSYSGQITSSLIVAWSAPGQAATTTAHCQPW